MRVSVSDCASVRPFLFFPPSFYDFYDLSAAKTSAVVEENLSLLRFSPSFNTPHVSLSPLESFSSIYFLVHCFKWRGRNTKKKKKKGKREMKKNTGFKERVSVVPVEGQRNITLEK